MKGIITFVAFKRRRCVLYNPMCTQNSCTSISLASNRLLGTYDHLINKDTKRPPVHRCRVALRCDDFRCNVLCNHQSVIRPSNRNSRAQTFRSNERIRPEIARACHRIHQRNLQNGQQLGTRHPTLQSNTHPIVLRVHHRRHPTGVI